MESCLITIEPITAKNVSLFKTVRLRALQEAPFAFSSTYAREAEFDDTEWLRRVERMNGAKGVGFLAAFLDANDATRAQLVSMWTDPAHRQRGIGRLLVNEILRWAHLRGARTLLLMVTPNNDAAMRFYERLGFMRTGRTEPFPNDPAVLEYEMSRAVP